MSSTHLADRGVIEHLNGFGCLDHTNQVRLSRARRKADSRDHTKIIVSGRCYEVPILVDGWLDIESRENGSHRQEDL